MKLYELLDKAEILSCSQPDTCLNVSVSGISSDSRNVGESCVFVCVRGTKTNGHFFIRHAIEGGAAAVIVEDPAFIADCGETPWILAADTRALLSEMLSLIHIYKSDFGRRLSGLGISLYSKNIRRVYY